MLNCFNFKSVKVVNPTTRQRVIGRNECINNEYFVGKESKEHEKENIIFDDTNVVDKWTIVCGSRCEYTEGFLDKNNIITYIKTRVLLNRNLFNLCSNLNRTINITRYKLKNDKKVLIDDGKEVKLPKNYVNEFLERAKNTIQNSRIR